MNKKLVYAFLGTILFFTLTPFIFFGDNAVITVHDNLDSLIPWYKMFHDNGLFFKFDAPTKGFSEMSTLYYGQLGFTFQALLYSVFDTFLAYALNYTFAVLFGILSMRLLLHKLFKIDPLISLAVSACYAILPVYQGWNIAVGTLPFIIFVFFHFALKPKGVFSRKTLLLVFYPAFSFFVSTGIFILGLWFVGTVIVCVKNKRPNPNLIAGFFLLSIGYILVDLRLFYVMFILKTPLNRAVFSVYPTGILQMTKTFLRTLKDYFFNGYYHGASMQRRVILPGAALLSAVLLPRFISSVRNRKQNGELSAVDNNIMLMFIIEAVIFIFSGIGALYDSGLLNNLVKTIMPVLAGFSWGRVWIFNRALWMAVFALCLSLLLSVKSIAVKFNRDAKEIVIPQVFFRITVHALVFFQGAYIMLSPVVYNDQAKTWFNEIVIKTGIARKITQRNFDEIISYKEFFAEELFHNIKKDIAYDDEMVAAFGYHPSVLMYNGFNCIDGYNNSYPLSYMEKFRTLLEPEFETNIKDRDYYDSWGGRMYLYNSHLSFEPIRPPPRVELRINMNVFRHDFNGKYILSRAEVSNADELGLFFVKRYDNEDSIYTIYLYKAEIE
jgi:hypothetical protein